VLRDPSPPKERQAQKPAALQKTIPTEVRGTLRASNGWRDATRSASVLLPDRPMFVVPGAMIRSPCGTEP
jgi:hypothetical protein